jgi:hypothetical protein
MKSKFRCKPLTLDIAAVKQCSMQLSPKTAPPQQSLENSFCVREIPQTAPIFCCSEPTICHIIDNLYLGDIYGVNESCLDSLNITHILSLLVDGEQTESYNEVTMRYKVKQLNVADKSDFPLQQFLDDAFCFIESSVNAGEKVLVHCRRGISRSPTLVIAYLIRKFQVPFRIAYEFVRIRRTSIDPKFGFRAFLEDYSNAHCVEESNMPAWLDRPEFQETISAVA